MDRSSPLQLGACSTSGSLRLAILALAMLGYMTLWSAMQGDLPESEVTLATRVRLGEQLSEVQQACLKTCNQLELVYQPIQNSVQSQWQDWDAYLTQIRQHAGQRQVSRRRRDLISVETIRRTIQHGVPQIRLGLDRVSHRASDLMLTAASDGVQVLATTIESQYRRLKLELPRISHGPGSSDQKSRR